MGTIYKLFYALLLAGLTTGHAVGWSVTSLFQSTSPAALQFSSAKHK